MEEQEKKTIKIPPIKWEEMKSEEGENLCAIEYLKPEGKTLECGIMFRILPIIDPSEDGYDAYVFIDLTYDLKRHALTLEKAKAACEEYRKNYWEDRLHCKIIVDENAEETCIKTVSM